MPGPRDTSHLDDRAGLLTKLLGFRAGLGGRPPNVDRAVARRDVKGLARALQYPDASLREKAVAGLSKVGGLGAMEHLIAALEDPEWRVRAVAAKQIGVLLEALKAGDLSGRDALVQTAAEPLLISLRQDDEWRVRAAAAEVLGSIGKDFSSSDLQQRVTKALLLALRNDSWALRRAASDSLIRMDGVVELLLAAVEDPLWCVRESVARALGQIGAQSSGTVPRGLLLRSLAATLQDQDARVRHAGAQALGRIAASAVEADQRDLALLSLVHALEDGEGRVREAAAEALGHLADARAVEPLLGVLNDESESVQRAAAKALDRLAKAQGIHTGPTAD